jgi:hypothetical protein
MHRIVAFVVEECPERLLIKAESLGRPDAIILPTRSLKTRLPQTPSIDGQSEVVTCFELPSKQNCVRSADWT